MARLQSELVISLIDRVTGPARRIAGTTERLRSASARNAQQLSRMRGSMFGAAAMAYALGRAIAAPVKTAADFETSMNRVAAVSGATGSGLVELRNQALELGRTTQYTASQAGDAMGFLAMAGFREKQIVGAMPDTLKLASAAHMDLASAADIVSNVLTGYNKKVSDLGHVNDVLVKAFTSANTNLTQLGQAMKYAGPVASAAGVHFEEAAAALALMGNAGIQSTMAGTSLRGAISHILAPTKKMRAAMKSAGLSFTDARGKLLPLTEIVRQLEPHADDAGLMMTLFGQRAGPAMAALVSQGSDALKTMTSDLQHSAGITKQISDVQMKGFNGVLFRFKSAVQGAQIAIGHALIPALTRLLDAIMPAIGSLTEFATAHKTVVLAATSLVGGLLGLRVVTVATRFAFLFLKGGVLDVGVAIARTASLVVAASRRIRLAIMGATMLGEIGGGSMFAGLVAGLSSAAGAVAGIAAGIGAAVAGITVPVWGLIAAIAGVALAVYNYWVPIRDFVEGFAAAVAAALDPVIASLLRFGARAAAAVGTWATAGLIRIGSWLGIDEATVRATLDAALAAVSGFAAQVVSIVKGLPAEIGDWISGIFEMNTYSAAAEASFRNAGVRAGAAMVAAIKAAFDGLLDWFAGLAGRIVAAIGRIDIGNLIQWPSPPAWLSRLWGGGSPAAPAASRARSATIPHRAAGGAVARGQTYLVGEEGPELFTASGDGMIHDAGKTAAMIGGGGAPSATTAGAPTIRFGDIHISLRGVSDPEKIADEVVATIQRKLRDAMAGAQFDQNYAVGL